MNSYAIKRIKKEFCQAAPTEEWGKCSISLANDSWTDLRAEISGPPGTAYEGGNFVLEIIVPESYPFRPPKVRFLTKIWHPNISSVNGALCRDVFKEIWLPCMTVRGAVLSIQGLLSAPELDNFENSDAAQQFNDFPLIFYANAKHWTVIYAGVHPMLNSHTSDSVV